ncbi:MAG: hypothetical protein GQ546_09905 [Gammaproteobacteria bacterium]|nr:hypothetical protein [Gammaproteobacteria bacterium]
MKKTLLILFLFYFNIGYGDELKPFTSDGCSVFPDGTLVYKESWLKCCIEHDKAYWQGGTYQQRQVADETLKFCVEKIGRPEIAKIMLNGVRVGGTPYLPTSFRWGYGWPYLRGYKVLTEQETKQVLKFINKL